MVRRFVSRLSTAMDLTTILNQCYRFPGFVYESARFSTDKTRIEVRVRPRYGATPICSDCQQRAPGYDHLAERWFEFFSAREN